MSFIISSVVNPITFKLNSGSYPTYKNRLHNESKAGGVSIIPYCQPCQINQSIILQFQTDDNEVAPILYAYIDEIEIDEITCTLASTKTGTEGTRYYWKAIIPSGSDYHYNEVSFLITQNLSGGLISLPSEPCYFDNYLEKIANQEMHLITYSNLDRVDSELSGFFIDWSVVGNDDNALSFLIESVIYDIKNKEEVEIFEGTQSYEIASASMFDGTILKTGIIPRYQVEKLKAASMLDFFAVNEVQFIRDGGADPDPIAGTTSFQLSLPLIEKNTLGLNVDNLGYSFGMTDEYLKFDGTDDGTGALTYTIEAGYALHEIFARHSGTSSGNAGTIKVGTTAGGDDLLSEDSGIIEASAEMHSFPIHFKPYSDLDTTVYITIAGTGVKLWIRLVKDRMIDFV